SKNVPIPIAKRKPNLLKLIKKKDNFILNPIPHDPPLKSIAK
ncbi:14024_t:CDS:1, partial [Cetraspora pellucida]